MTDPVLTLVQELIVKLESPLHQRDAALAKGDTRLADLIQGELDIVAADLRQALHSLVFVQNPAVPDALTRWPGARITEVRVGQRDGLAYYAGEKPK